LKLVLQELVEIPFVSVIPKNIWDYSPLANSFNGKNPNIGKENENALTRKIKIDCYSQIFRELCFHWRVFGFQKRKNCFFE
jgi:hypothetical protein